MQAAAQVGASGHDFCVISLSDILKPWTIIEQRITAAVQADFVLVFTIQYRNSVHGSCKGQGDHVTVALP
jgi:precorrin-3B methylase